MSGIRQPSQSVGSGSTTNSARGANSRIRCSCGKYAAVRTVKNGPNMGMRFYGFPLWPDTQCEMFNWVTTSTDLEGLELKIMEKDTEICELEYEKKLKEDKIKKLQLKKDKYCDALAGMKTEMEELKTQIRKRRKNERRMYLMLLLSWIVFGFSYVYG
ncbi:uncharacterized protein LOC110709313 [Chenopodium quinoa]|uniref:uncharacterized protein LOC110709313 n=1 Tax=Chenopodium quinoa TaxID=63459 RepID=UPI000B7962AB|nr:uncharacterized protein LOC110709313 [Chenopodium quinoa]